MNLSNRIVRVTLLLVLLLTGACSLAPSRFVSSEVLPGVHYTEISNAELANETRIRNDLTAYANRICETGFSIESTDFTEREQGRLPGTICRTLGCLTDVLLISVIKCDDESSNFEIQLMKEHAWHKSSEDMNAFLDANYNSWRDNYDHPAYTSLFTPMPERILENGANMDVFVYEDTYMVVRKDPRMLGSIIEVVQFRLGTPTIVPLAE